jgi:aminoglycoside phosphotransferase (APT) family kinase protein
VSGFELDTSVVRGEEHGSRDAGAVKLIAAGRASEIFDLGDGRVLRRFKTQGDPEREALVMRHARRHGYPVPRVFDVTRDALVLGRLEGPTMAEQITADASTLAANATVLARLHDRLHALAAPATLLAITAGDRLLHLDLHPANVILAASGPVVIDWTNARRGDPAFDVALTWVIGATSSGRRRLPGFFLDHFLSHFRRLELLDVLALAAEFRLADANVTAGERRAIRRLVLDAATRSP